MHSLALNQLLYRRTAQALTVVSGAAMLYAWKVILLPSPTSLTVTLFAAIGATVALLIAVVGLLWRPKKYSELLLFAAYILLACTAAYLALINDYAPATLALWATVAVIAGIFSGYGIVPVFIAGNYQLFSSVIEGVATTETLLVTLVTGWLPVITGYVLWHKGKQRTKGTSALDSLTNELSEVTGQSEAIIQAIADGVINIDGKGVITLINPAAQRMSGWSAQDALALSYKSVFKLIDATNKPVGEAEDPIQHVLTTGKQVEFNHFSLATKSDKRPLISLVVSPIGQIGSGAIIVFRDITKEKKEEREMAEFISTASHEMRTPVASIEGYLGLALNPSTATIDDKARDFITKAHESAQHLGRLFQDLLDVSKAEDGRLSSDPKVIDVVEYVGNVVDGLRPQADAKQLRLTYKPLLGGETDPERKLSPIYYANVDADHLREAVSNLAENAIKYTPQGDVIVDVTGDETHIVISFQDSGIGIPAEDIPHLFQKFYRVDNTDTREIGGTGLGLYLCRRLIEMMDGRIRVESEFRKGSTFYIEIPRISHEEANRLIEQAIQQAEATTAMQATSTAPQDHLPPQVTPAPQPAVTPVPTTVATPQQQAPVQPQPVQPLAPATQPPSTPIAAAPTPTPAATPTTNENTPLSTIEQNPGAYTQERAPSVNIPTRYPDGQN